MFYRPGTDDAQPAHSPFKAIVSPRPIGWVSTLNPDGSANLAPYSFFNALADKPPIVIIGSGGSKPDQVLGKDTLANISRSGEFVINIVSHDLRDAMNVSSASLPAGFDEFDHAGVTKAAGRSVSVPHVAEAPAALECRLWQILALPGTDNHAAIGQVVGIHIRDELMENDMLDVLRYRPLARLGYRDYASIDKVFALNRPGQT